MSDFTANFWSVYVAGFTLVGILACLVLLWVTARKKIVSAADNTTGHVWDEDLTEMNNPMPRWWMWLFVLTIVFSFLYLAAYPGLGTYEGELGWTSKAAYEGEVDRANQELAPLYAQFTARKVEEVAGDPQATSSTAWTARATRPWARPTSPTTPGCTATARKPSCRSSTTARPTPCRPNRAS